MSDANGRPDHHLLRRGTERPPTDDSHRFFDIDERDGRNVAVAAVRQSVRPFGPSADVKCARRRRYVVGQKWGRRRRRRRGRGRLPPRGTSPPRRGRRGGERRREQVRQRQQQKQRFQGRHEIRTSMQCQSQSPSPSWPTHLNSFRVLGKLSTSRVD